MKSFLLMGQSNMAGRGYPADVPPITDKRCFMLRNGRWQPLRDPVVFDRPMFGADKMGTCSGVGPGSGFAAAYAEAYDEKIGLIPCADGGTSLEDWRIDGQLFLHAFYQAKLAMNVSEIAGILWHQGEGDSGTVEKASSYKDRFLTMIDEFRGRLGLQIPVVVGELGDFLDRRPIAHWRIVNEQLRAIADERADMALVSSAGLRDRGDNLHFDAASQREFGRRYFDAYQTLVKGKNA